MQHVTLHCAPLHVFAPTFFFFFLTNKSNFKTFVLMNKSVVEALTLLALHVSVKSTKRP